jgi:TRAP-type mannitol/chloroaromatic compound transport system substrate-binding protein
MALFSVMLMLTVVSCAAPSPAEEEEEARPAPEEEEEEEAAPAEPEEEVITWVGQSQFSAGSMEHESFERASALVSTLSSGRLVAEPHPAGAIAPALEAFDAVDSGSLDYAWVPGNYLRDKWLVASLFDNEINGMSPVEQFLWFLEGGGAELAQEMVEEYDVYVTRSGSLFPPEIFLSTTKELSSLQDVKGLKVRTAGDDGAIFTEMGASVVMVPGGEIYESMQRGVIDGFQFMSPAGDITMGFDEVVDYMYLSPVRQPCSTTLLLANSDKWASLSDDLKAVIEDAFLAEAWTWYGKVVQADGEAIEEYKESGVTVGPIPGDIEAEMAELAEDMYAERAAEDPFYAEVLESRHRFQDTIRETYERL